MRVVGYGETMPLVPNASTTNKQSNRRVEIQAIKWSLKGVKHANRYRVEAPLL